MGLRIKSIRKTRGLSQEQLADVIGRSLEAVSNLERGLALPSFATLDRLSRALDVPVREFFDLINVEEENPNRSRLIHAIVDVARALDMDDLKIAVEQVASLTRGRERSKPVGRRG